jgi:hypothetical protein
VLAKSPLIRSALAFLVLGILTFEDGYVRLEYFLSKISEKVLFIVHITSRISRICSRNYLITLTKRKEKWLITSHIYRFLTVIVYIEGFSPLNLLVQFARF